MEDENDSQFKITKAEEVIRNRILIIRECKVMLDRDLAELYGVSTKRFNEQVRRNTERFPPDFMFQLTQAEYENLRSQIATSSSSYGGRRYLPYAFTEHGVAMLSSILSSKQAILMNIFIIRAFIKMRESLDNYRDLSIKIGEIEVNQIHDHAMIKNVNEVVKHLLDKPNRRKYKIGFNE